MCSDELAANLFRISLAKQKIAKEKVIDEKQATQTHYFVGQKVRNTIQELGGMMPEQCPTPNKSLKELESEQRRELLKKK